VCDGIVEPSRLSGHSNPERMSEQKEEAATRALFHISDSTTVGFIFLL